MIPAFKNLFLWGLDDMLVYHYLVSEAFRHSSIAYEKFAALPKTAQADLIWNELFVKNSPISEACRGVLTTLNRLGLEVWKRDLGSLRRWFSRQSPEAHLERVLELARIDKIYMTNSPFDAEERRVWEKGFRRDERFVAALRVDPLLMAWPEAGGQLSGWGYKVTRELSRKTLDQVKRFLGDWTRRMEAAYVMVSLPPDFAFPGRGDCAQLLEKAVLPFCQEAGLPSGADAGGEAGG
jgi:hypothetical protein